MRSSVHNRVQPNIHGRHLIAELLNCNPSLLSDMEAVKSGMMEAARRARATIVTTAFHPFKPFGISGVVVICESHLSIHTWPEHRYAAVDVFTCGNTLKPDRSIVYLEKWFEAEQVSMVEIKRGIPPDHKAVLTQKRSRRTIK